MRGMSRETGKHIDDLEHLKQSIIDILTTPVGSRVMCREYGSNLFYLTDRPINRELFPQIYAAVAESLGRWEPRLKLEKIIIEEIKEGKITLSLRGLYLLTQQTVNIERLII
jgi:phage baseplate assembly protein W